MKPMDEELKVTVDQVLNPQPKKLPEKLSELIRVALADAKLIQKDPRYKINMSTWHSPANSRIREDTGTRCYVCLAGCVMAKSLGFSPQEFHEPSQLDQELERKLRALDLIRSGDVIGAAIFVYGRVHVKALAGYDDLIALTIQMEDQWKQKHRHIGWDNIAKIADELETHGL